MRKQMISVEVLQGFISTIKRFVYGNHGSSVKETKGKGNSFNSLDPV